MVISELEYRDTEGEQEVSAKVSPATSRGGSFRVWFRASSGDEALAVSGDSFLAGFLIPCMWAGEDLHVEAPVSPALMKNVPSIQALIRTWYPDFRAIGVTCDDDRKDGRPGTDPGPGHACCFSGGVDSWYSLLKNEDAITHLLLVRGFDMEAESHGDHWERTLGNAKRVAEKLDKRLLAVTTNLREVTDFTKLFPRGSNRREADSVAWGRKYSGMHFFGECSHGSILAAVGHALTGSIRRLIIPSSADYSSLFASWGSHPLLDPLFSTNRLGVMHCGCEATRVEKAVEISACELAVETLRVCVTGRQDLNCGVCEKCLITKLMLRLSGVLESANSFPDRSLDQARRLIVRKWYRLSDVRKIGERADELGDSELSDICRIITGEKFSLMHLSLLVRSRCKGILRYGRDAFFELRIDSGTASADSDP